MMSNIVLMIYIFLSTCNYKEFSLDSIYKETTRKIEYLNKLKNSNPKFDAKVNLVISNKKNIVSKKMKLLNSGLVNKENIDKYIVDTKILKWSDLATLKEFKVRIINKVLVNSKNKQILAFLQKIKSKNKINNKSFLHIIKAKILKYLIKKNCLYFIGLIADDYCNCNIQNKNISTYLYLNDDTPIVNHYRKYNNMEVYVVQKKFIEIKKDFKIKHDFKIKISKEGEVVNLDWHILGEKIDNKQKENK